MGLRQTPEAYNNKICICCLSEDATTCSLKDADTDDDDNVDCDREDYTSRAERHRCTADSPLLAAAAGGGIIGDGATGYHHHHLDRHRHHVDLMEAAACRKKKTRTVFSRAQVLQLESTFDAKRYLSSAERSNLALALRLTETQVCVKYEFEYVVDEFVHCYRLSVY